MHAAATTVLKLLQGAKVFIVPRYQRRYDWRLDRWQPFWDDILHEYAVEHSEESQELDGHFLGSIVLHPAAGPASTLMQHLVIDGQQRLTTILVLLAALRDVRVKSDPSWNPGSIDDQYLRNAYAESERERERLLPTEPDRAAYVLTVRDGQPTAGVGEAYEFFTKSIRAFLEQPDSNLAKLEATILLHLLVVEITTSHHDSVNAIFNTLNSKSQPLTAADLVRNELLLHVGEAQAERAYEEYWRPMERHLIAERKTVRGTINDPKELVSFLWSREAAVDPRATKERLFFYFEKRMKESLKGLDVERRKSRAMELLQQIHEDHELFRIVRRPALAPSTKPFLSSRVIESLQMLSEWGGETTNPFALWGLREHVAGRVTEDDLVLSIEMLLGYLIRRVLAGFPTQTLNRTLTPLASEVARRSGGDVATALAAALSRPGSYWVDDKTVLARVESTALFTYRRTTVLFVLEQIESLLPGPHHDVNPRNQIEHIMPRALSGEWLQYLSDHGAAAEDATALTHTLGNLTLSANNQRMGQSLFAEKRPYFSSSGLRINQQLAELDDFLPEQIRARSRNLASVLLNRFPGPRMGGSPITQTSEIDVLRQRLETILQTMPDGAWTTVDDLVVFLAAEEAQVRELVSFTRPTLTRLVRDTSGAIPAWLSPMRQDEVRAQGKDQTRPEMRYRDSDLTDLQSLLESALDGEDSVDIDDAPDVRP